MVNRGAEEALEEVNDLLVNLLGESEFHDNICFVTAGYRGKDEEVFAQGLIVYFSPL